MTAETVRVTPEWLELREPADASARSVELVEVLRTQLPSGRRAVIHDLGCGTGSMTRWLAPLLPDAQHWVLHDRDADLLEHVSVEIPNRPDVTFTTRRSDITHLATAGIEDASLLTASALLDMFNRAELDRFVRGCAAAHCPALITLSVTGRVECAPHDPLDSAIQDAFNAHQRREVDGQRLLGPDAVALAAETFEAMGFEVRLAPSPWHLDADHADLTTAWLDGWVAAAIEQKPDLATVAVEYVRRRAAEIESGRLVVTVQHDDLLVIPR